MTAYERLDAAPRGSAAPPGWVRRLGDPLMSFVIPVRNDAGRLTRCLESIARNEYPAGCTEVIVVDNGSRDDSAAAARACGARVVERASGHVGELRNAGADQARGEILAFVDADHELCPDWIRAAVAALSEGGAGGAGDLCHGPPGGTWVQRAYDGFRTPARARTDVEWLGSGNLVVWRRVFQTLGGFDPRLATCEDVDLSRRLRARGYRLIRDPGLRSVHHGDPATLGQLFRGELWRGRDNLKVTLKGALSVKDVPSVMIPLLDLTCLGLIGAGVASFSVAGLVVALVAAATVAVLALARAVRVVRNLRTRHAADISGALAVAFVYDVARALALVVRPRHHRRRGAPREKGLVPRRPVRVLELRSVRGTGGGPEKTILLGASRSDPRRVHVTVCYVRDRRDEIFGIDAKARAMGVDYVEILERHSFDPSVWPALKRLVAERGIDIVHAHDYKTNLLTLLLAWRTGIVPMATAHGWSGTSRRERFYYVFDRRMIRMFPAAIAVSEKIRQTVIQYGARPERVHRICNGIDPSEFARNPAVRDRIRRELSVDPDAVAIGGIGRLEPIKRFDVLLRAAARLHVDLRPVVVIAGDGSCRAPLCDLAASLGLSDRVRWLGHRQDVRDVCQGFDVFVQSSDSEGMPNAVLEAMALETPVVATDVGGTSELIEHGVHGLLAPREDPVALAKAIELTFSDPAQTRRRILRARQRIERDLSFEARTRAVEQLYLTLTGHSPSAPEDEIVQSDRLPQLMSTIGKEED